MRKRKGANVILFAALAVALIVSLVSCKPKSAPASGPVDNVAKSEEVTLRPEDIPLPKVDSVQRKESTSAPANNVGDVPLPKVDSIQRKETTSPPPSEPVTTTPEPATTSYSYVLNTNTMRIHKPNCSSVNEMNPKNRQSTNQSIEELEAEGYVKCKRCF